MMHPNGAFEWTSREEMLEFVSEHSFAHIFMAGDEGLFVVHAPLLVTKGGKIWFHISRRNRAAGQIDGRCVLVSIVGREGYHSANWYASKNQVSTWHYEAVEIEGSASALPADGLVELLDRLSDRMEARYSPGQPWTRAKMEPGKFEALTKAIIGFEVIPTAIRGTRKFNQHRAVADLEASIEGQQLAGRDDIIAAMHELTRPK